MLSVGGCAYKVNTINIWACRLTLPDRHPNLTDCR